MCARAGHARDRRPTTWSAPVCWRPRWSWAKSVLGRLFDLATANVPESEPIIVHAQRGGHLKGSACVG